MNSYDWIVFDSTGTLMTPHPEPAAVYARIAGEFGADHDPQSVRPQLKDAMVRHFLGDNALLPTDEANERLRWKKIVRDSISVNEATFEECFQQLWDHFAQAEHWKLFVDVVPTFDALRSKGYRIGIASNFDARLRNLVDGLGLQAHVDAVLISSDLGWSKPNTKFYDAATQRLSLSDRSRVLMIGDTLDGDVVAAKRAGWNARHLVRETSDALLQLTGDL